MLRRGFLLGTVAAFAFDARAAGTTLRATHFGGPYEILVDLIGKPFAAAKLGTVEYEVAISPAVLAKLQAGRDDPPFDVVMVSRSFGRRMLTAGLLETLTPADITDSAQLMKDALPEAGWGVAMVLDTYDIMLDTKQVPTPVTSWLDLWKPEYAGKIALPAAADGGGAFAFISCIVRAIGNGDHSDAVVNEAFTRLKALKPAVRVFCTDSVQQTQLIDRGDIAIAPEFGIRIANMTKRSPNIVKATPKEGVAAIPYDLCIPKGARNAALAKTYINFALTPAVQTGLLESLLATPARTGLPVPPSLASLVTTDPAHIWFQDEAFATSKQREWLDRYTREVQS